MGDASAHLERHLHAQRGVVTLVDHRGAPAVDLLANLVAPVGQLVPLREPYLDVVAIARARDLEGHLRVRAAGRVHVGALGRCVRRDVRSARATIREEGAARGLRRA